MLISQGKQEIPCIVNDNIVRKKVLQMYFLPIIPVILTSFSLQVKSLIDVPIEVSLWLACELNASNRFEVKINVTKCPNGLKFDEKSMTCKCSIQNRSKFLCHPDQDHAGHCLF